MQQHYGPAWQGCQIHGDTLTTDNGESYTLQELRFLRWERNQYAASSRALARELERSGRAGAVWFSDEEWRQLREAVRILDARLGGAVRRVA